MRIALLILLLLLGGECRAELPLGPPGLPERREVEQLAPGLRLTTIVRGSLDSKGREWLQFAPLPPEKARELAARWANSRLVEYDTPAPDRPGPLVPRQVVRIPMQTPIPEGATRVHTSEDAGPATGPWVVRVLEVDLTLHRVTAELGPGRTRPSAHHALAAVNGGYFVETFDPGEPAGISVLNGHLMSEALGDRGALVLEKDRVRIERVCSRVILRRDEGGVVDITGINRTPGLARSYLAEPPYIAHDTTCRLEDDLVLFDGGYTTPEQGYEVVLDEKSRVVSMGAAETRVLPPGRTLLCGIGACGDWLRKNLRVGNTVTLVRNVSVNDPPSLSTKVRLCSTLLPPDASVVNGGPILLKDGQLVEDGWAEGFDLASDPTFYHRFGVRRHPRTLAGTTAEGKLLLVTIDGHQPDYSIGASFHEAALVMQALGCRDALNLDGGGSTTMVVGQEVINRPSDGQERSVGDVILVH